MEIKVFTLEYQPFVMGGDVWQPVATTVEADGPHDLGAGQNGFVVTTPNRKTFIAEAKSGGLIGPDLKTVKEDVRIADPEVMEQQVKNGITQCGNARVVKPDEFWKLLKCTK